MFDSFTTDVGGVADGFALLGSVRRKLSTEPISAPYRHGILYGLDPEYDQPIVAAKAFNLLEAVLDYFDRKASEAVRLGEAAEAQRPADLEEVARKALRTQEISRALDNWTARPPRLEVVATSDDASGLTPDSPEAAAVRYLKHLTNRNWGGLAKAIDYMRRPINLMAGRVRNDLDGLAIDRWRMVGLHDDTAATSHMVIELTGKLKGEAWSGSARLRVIRMDAELLPIPRGATKGEWLVQPDFQSKLWLVALQSD